MSRTRDEGYVKYSSEWRAAPAPDAGAVRLLDAWRRPLYDAGLVGYDEEQGVGFGNISIRAPRPGEFIITGTQTGHLRDTNGAHYCRVVAADVALKAVDASLETHGGIGFAEETGLAQLWNGARVLKTAPLNREMILNYVAEQDLGLPRSY